MLKNWQLKRGLSIFEQAVLVCFLEAELELVADCVNKSQ